MTKEKIKELLLSRDKELRLLGLSYLNEDKNSPELWISSHYTVSLLTEIFGSATLFKDIYTIITTWDYNKLPENFLIDTFPKILTPYIDYCYK